MTKIRNKTILITGGASGIGRLIAHRCLQKKATKAILWDINPDALASTKAFFESKGFEIETAVVDISSQKAIIETAQRLKEAGTVVDILFNNAGIVVGKPFEEHSHEDIAKTIDINVSGVMHTALALLPDMLKKGKGHLVNIASAAGLMANPNMSVYAGSKWAVIGWSESIRIEMERDKTGVRVTTVMPSYINTGMFDGVKAPLFTPILTPEFIVKKILQAVERNQPVVQEPFMTKTVPLLRSLLPSKAFDYVANTFGVYKSMDDFKGR